MSLIIETVGCSKCGKTLTIEMDVREKVEKAKEKFRKKHEGCKGAGNKNL